MTKNDLESLKVILPFVALITQYFIRTFAAPRLGDTFVETKIIHLLKFRIPPLDDATKDNIKHRVDRILAVKQRDAEADTSALEREIDELVYALYGLQNSGRNSPCPSRRPMNTRFDGGNCGSRTPSCSLSPSATSRAPGWPDRAILTIHPRAGW